MKALVLMIMLTSVLVFNGATASASNCARYIGTCNYYACLSNEVSCGASDYPLDFGYHYCHAFDEETASFTAHGRAFLSQVKACLQRKIEARPVRVCGDVEAGAPADHLECYTQAHFCSLSLRDQALIGETVFVTMVSKPGFRDTAEKISESCGYLP